MLAVVVTGCALPLLVLLLLMLQHTCRCLTGCAKCDLQQLLQLLLMVGSTLAFALRLCIGHKAEGWEALQVCLE